MGRSPVKKVDSILGCWHGKSSRGTATSGCPVHAYALRRSSMLAVDQPRAPPPKRGPRAMRRSAPTRCAYPLRKPQSLHFAATALETSMPTTLEQLTSQAIALSPEDRACLAGLRLASLPDEADEPLDEAWDQEIQRRLMAVESGTARLVSAAYVHDEARKIIRR